MGLAFMLICLFMCFGGVKAHAEDEDTALLQRTFRKEEARNSRLDIKLHKQEVKETASSTCSKGFILNPQDIEDKNIFLDQFKPCGWYKDNCQHMFQEWFRDEGGFRENDEDYVIRDNVCYPGSGEDDLNYGVHLVEFDIGLDKTAYDAYLLLKDEPGGDELLDDIDTVRNYLTFPKNAENQYYTNRNMTFGETCVETFAKTDDHWGKARDDLANTYDCMGTCGPSCGGVGRARDCLKHDVCSYFKSLALGENSQGFCADFDCGDEAAQTVTNCWIHVALGRDQNVICDKEEDDTNPNFYGEINPAARFQGQKMACTLRTSWDRNQGIPWQRHEDGHACASPDDCRSRRCDRASYLSLSGGVCHPKLENGEHCNENSDCISDQCGGRNPFSWTCY